MRKSKYDGRRFFKNRKTGIEVSLYNLKGVGGSVK